MSSSSELILGIETSDQGGSVALVREGELLGVKSLSQRGRRHAQTLVAELKTLYHNLALDARETSAVAASIGPGSFTGVRVGVTCAKTFAYATGCRVVAVETLAVVAAGVPLDADRLWVIADAQRQELFVAGFERSEDTTTWRCFSDVTVHPASQWIESRDPEEVVIGTAVPRHAEALAGARVRSLEVHPTAEQVARLAAVKLAAGETRDPWSLVPAYHRRSAAEDQWEKRPTR